MTTGFLWHEKYMWHDTGSGAAANIEPGEHFENPDTKRRMKNLLDLSGMTDKLVRLDPRMATEDELRPVLEEGSGLKAGSDFHLAYSPEREDPGNPHSKVAKIPKVIGGYTPECLEKAKAV